MGTITRRDNGKYQVKIRRDGSSLSKTFKSFEDARRWERAREVELDHGVDFSAQLELRQITLGQLAQRWIEEILPDRPSARYEGPEVRRLLEDPISEKSLAHLTKADFRGLLKRLKTTLTARGTPPSPDTVIRKWSVFRTVINHIRDEWDYGHWPHPMKGIRLPKPSPWRIRRREPADIRRVVAAWHPSNRELVVGDDGSIGWRPFKDSRARGGCRNGYIRLIVRLSWETATRRSELLSVRVENIDFKKRELWLEQSATKNKEGRRVPLSAMAIKLIGRALRQPGRVQDEKLLFPVSLNAFKCAWRGIRKRARLTEADIRFHDGRREAISRGIDAGLSLPQVIGLSGHKDFRSLRRYCEPDLGIISAALDTRRARERSAKQAKAAA